MEEKINALKCAADTLAGVGGGYSPEERQRHSQTLYEMYQAGLSAFEQDAKS